MSGPSRAARGCERISKASEGRAGRDTGRLMLNVIDSVAQFEREVMLERQREGIAKATSGGKYTGRAPTARAKAADVRRPAAAGMTREVIATELKIGVASSTGHCAWPRRPALCRTASNSVVAKEFAIVSALFSWCFPAHGAAPLLSNCSTSRRKRSGGKWPSLASMGFARPRMISACRLGWISP